MEASGIIEESWREILHEYVLYSLLFKALMVDAVVVEGTATKLRYNSILELLSLRAERQYHQYRRELYKAGCKVTLTEKRGTEYYVQVKTRRLIEEAFYSTEYLRAECEIRLENLVKGNEHATGIK